VVGSPNPRATVVDGAASKATAARLAASPSAASARDGSPTGLRAAFANGAKPSVAARMRASLEGELGAKMPRVLDRPEPATKSPGSSFTLPERSRVVPTIPLSQQGTGDSERGWVYGQQSANP
jgi:hypothetical protein